MSQAQPERLVSLDELSTYTGLNRETVTRLAVTGTIPSFRFGRQYRFDLVAVLDATRAIAPQAPSEGRHE